MGKTQEENCNSSVWGGARETLVSHLVWILPVFANFVNSGMSLTFEQVVTQLQQEEITLKALVAGETGLVDAVRAINHLATAQVRKDTPSLIDVTGLGRPKEVSGKEEDFQQWLKKTEAFFASVLKEFEMMLECAEEATEITTTAIDLELLPTSTNVQRGTHQLEFVLLQMYTALMALASYEANDIVANSRKNTLEAWRRLRTIWSDDRRKKGERASHAICPGKVLSVGTPCRD